MSKSILSPFFRSIELASLNMARFLISSCNDSIRDSIRPPDTERGEGTFREMAAWEGRVGVITVDFPGPGGRRYHLKQTNHEKKTHTTTERAHHGALKFSFLSFRTIPTHSVRNWCCSKPLSNGVLLDPKRACWWRGSVCPARWYCLDPIGVPNGVI